MTTRAQQIQARCQAAIKSTRMLRDQDVSLAVYAARHDIPYLLARLASCEAALEQARAWFDQAIPQDTGCDFLNEGGWDDAGPLHEAIISALAQGADNV